MTNFGHRRGAAQLLYTGEMQKRACFVKPASQATLFKRVKAYSFPSQLSHKLFATRDVVHPVILREEMEESAKRENVQMYVKQTITQVLRRSILLF